MASRPGTPLTRIPLGVIAQGHHPVPRTHIGTRRLVWAAFYASVVIVLNAWPTRLVDGETGHEGCCQEVHISRFRGWPAPLLQTREVWSYHDGLVRALSSDSERPVPLEGFNAAWDARVETAKNEFLPLTHYTYIPFFILVLDRLPEVLGLILGAALDATVLFGGAALILYFRRKTPNTGVEADRDA